MPLCLDHRRGIADRQSGACPRCLFPLDSAPLFRELEDTQRMITEINKYPFVDFRLLARLTAKSDQLMAAGDELIARGIVHKCRLELVEVS